MRGAELERLDQRREGVRVFSETEIGGYVRGTARARLVPSNDRELVGQRSELGLPDAAVLPRLRAQTPAAVLRLRARTRSRARLSGRRSRAELNKPRHLRCSRAPDGLACLAAKLPIRLMNQS